MKTSLLTPWRSLLAVLVCAAAPLARAIPLDFDTHGIGYYSPASQANNNTDATNAVNAMVNWYNGGANPNGGSITYTFDVGTSVPAAPLPTPISFGFKDESAPYGDIDSSVYSYALGKYGNVAFILYLGNLAPGNYSMPANLGGHDLSHFLALSAPRTSVPEGGTTMALLGLGLLFLEGVRRRLKLA